MRTKSLAEVEMVETPREHDEYLKKKDFDLGDAEGLFDPNEVKMLRRYGHWLEALASWEIEPFTREQERFVEVAHGELEPESEFERLWLKLIEWKEEQRLTEWNREKKEAEAEIRGISPIIAAGNRWTGGW